MRPTVKEFVVVLRDAYNKIGYSPCNDGCFYNHEEKKCCPLGALTLARGEEPTADTCEAINESVSFSLIMEEDTGYDEYWAFIQGWDNTMPETEKKYPYFYNLGRESREEIMS